MKIHRLTLAVAVLLAAAHARAQEDTPPPYGSAVEVNKRKSERGSIRDILSEFTVREVRLK
jgi:hypothetical protein